MIYDRPYQTTQYPILRLQIIPKFYIMHFQISDNALERLDQLNRLLTELVFRFERMEEDNLLLIKMNISKWKSDGHTIMLRGLSAAIPVDPDQLITLYKAYSIIGEILVFRREQDDAVKKQEFEKAAQNREMQKHLYEKLQILHLEMLAPIPFFSFTSNQLEMSLIEQHFLSDYIHKNLGTY